MLQQIIETKKEEVSQLTLPEKTNLPHRSLYKAFIRRKRPVGLLAEVKQASPSKGKLTSSFKPLLIAHAYEQGGADAISVLTDRTFFQGVPELVTTIKQKVNLPVLRKDFIIHPKQIEESVRIGADAILLIAEVLPPKQLQELYVQAHEQGLECLVEVHSVSSLVQLLDVFTPKMIGVNNRNLHTFETSIDQTMQVAPYLPKDTLFISESGIQSYIDIQLLQQAGADGVLVGEALMREEDKVAAIQRLMGDADAS
jgi:indole-3-glycerol phosphate synthase